LLFTWNFKQSAFSSVIYSSENCVTYCIFISFLKTSGCNNISIPGSQCPLSPSFNTRRFWHRFKWEGAKDKGFDIFTDYVGRWQLPTQGRPDEASCFILRHVGGRQTVKWSLEDIMNFVAFDFCRPWISSSTTKNQSGNESFLLLQLAYRGYKVYIQLAVTLRTSYPWTRHILFPVVLHYSQGADRKLPNSQGACRTQYVPMDLLHIYTLY
jgi:hypothetical protein